MFKRVVWSCCALLTSICCVVSQAADKPASSGQVLNVQFEPAPEGSKLAPNFSPKGSQVPLTPMAMPALAGSDHLAGQLKLGPRRDQGKGQLIVLARSVKDKPYDLLFVDLGHDGSVADDAPLRATPNLNRGNWWSSFNAPLLRVNHATANQPAAWESYPVNFWAVVEKPEEQPAMIRYSRRGFLLGTATYGDTSLTLNLSDSDNDGVLQAGDWWCLRPTGPEKPFTGDQNRAVGDFHWAAGKAWKLELTGTTGRQGRLIEFDPGMTEEEDTIRRDKLRDDRLAARAAVPIRFRNDADEAIKAARAAGQPYFLEFEADWCIPCKQMHTWVFTAKDVADAAAGVICITIDGDDRKDLVEKHNAKGYPHGILFAADGAELARFSGYRSVKETTAFFRKLPGSAPSPRSR